MGVVTYAGGVSSIGYGGDLLTGTIIESFALAGYQGKAHTHCVASYVRYRSNNRCAWIYSNARYDCRGNDYRKNRNDIEALYGFLSRDTTYVSDYHFGETYAMGPDDEGDGNFEPFRFWGYSLEDATMFGDAPVGGLDICHQRQSTAQTGIVALTKTRDLCTVYAGGLTSTSTGRYMEVFLCGETTGAGAKSVTVRLGTTIMAVLGITGAGGWTARIEIWPVNSTSQAVIAVTTGVATVSGGLRQTKLANMNSDQVLSAWQQIDASGDTATVHEARVVMWG